MLVEVVVEVVVVLEEIVVVDVVVDNVEGFRIMFKMCC